MCYVEAQGNSCFVFICVLPSALSRVYCLKGDVVKYLDEVYIVCFFFVAHRVYTLFYHCRELQLVLYSCCCGILFLMKFKYALRIVCIGVVLYCGIVYLDGVTLLPIEYGILASFLLLFAIFAVIEVLLYPIMKMMLLPLRILTFGLASTVLSFNLVYIVAILYPFFEVSSFWQALLLSIAFGVVRSVTK